MKDNRYYELDSLRGVAAMLVFIFHMLMIVPSTWADGLVWKTLYLSPLHHLLIGDKRVIFFFVLSGFVLSLPFLKGKKMSYSSFIIRRLIRLYIPYAIAITFAIIACGVFSRGGIKDLGGLFNQVWVSPTEIGLVIKHFIFIGNYDVYAYNIAIWSLIHELRIAFIFPLLVFLALKYNWRINLTIGLCLAVMGAGIHLVVQDPYQPFYKTLFYIIMFIIGILICKYKDKLTDLYKAMSKFYRIGLFITGYFIYNYSDFINNPLFADWLTTIGVSILIVVVLASNFASKILLWRPFRYLGKISYGVYLYHLPVLFTLLYLLYGKLHLMIIMGLALIITVAISNLTWYIIEQPTMKLAKFLSVKYSYNIKENILVEEKRSTS